MVIIKNYTEPVVNKKEILRYAGCKSLTPETKKSGIDELLEECIKEALPRLSYKVCYMELPLMIRGDVCDFGYLQVQSKDLVKNLKDCKRVILFGATLGVEIDRLITRYEVISPAKAVMFQAIGAERIESLCDVFCADLENELVIRPRFSPGYGDLPLEIQQNIIKILECSKYIGITLNDSLLMSPSKSVTAFIGVMSDKIVSNDL